MKIKPWKVCTFDEVLPDGTEIPLTASMGDDLQLFELDPDLLQRQEIKIYRLSIVKLRCFSYAWHGWAEPYHGWWMLPVAFFEIQKDFVLLEQMREDGYRKVILRQKDVSY